jgi:hypothetical protein
MTARYSFEEVRAALQKHWGLHLYRGGELGDGQHDGRWDVTYSRTGYVINGELPRGGYGSVRYPTLARVVIACDLAPVIERARNLRT